MNLAARLAPLFALLAAPFCAPSQAADYEVASSLVCDTQEQVERFVALFAGNAQAAIRVVNAEQKNPTACAMMNIAFMRGNQLGTARHGDNAFQITHILVIGIENGNGIQPVQPAAYYSSRNTRSDGDARPRRAAPRPRYGRPSVTERPSTKRPRKVAQG
jgi:hypothetical protein